jgi:hypothetical protein
MWQRWSRPARSAAVKVVALRLAIVSRQRASRRSRSGGLAGSTRTVVGSLGTPPPGGSLVEIGPLVAPVDGVLVAGGGVVAPLAGGLLGGAVAVALALVVAEPVPAPPVWGTVLVIAGAFVVEVDELPPPPQAATSVPPKTAMASSCASVERLIRAKSVPHESDSVQP